MIKSEAEIEDYMEVTDAEKVKLEASDAAWEEPDAALIDRWHLAWFNGRFGAYYNPRTGYFEADGEKAISTSQARRILDIGYIRGRDYTSTRAAAMLYVYNLPILLPISIHGGAKALVSCTKVDTIRLANYYILENNENPDKRAIAITDTREMFYISYVKRVNGIIDVTNDASYMHHFYNCRFSKLESIWIQNLNKGIDLRNAENFKLECLRYMIDYAMTMEAGQEIKLHSNLFNRIIDESDTEAHELLGLANEKNIILTTNT